MGKGGVGMDPASGKEATRGKVTGGAGPGEGFPCAPGALARIGAFLVLLAAAPSGCTPSDALEGLPEAAVRFLEPGRASLQSLAPGVAYRTIRSSREPWSVHLLEVEGERCEVGFQVVGLEPRGSTRLPVSELVRKGEGGVLAAVNGDFFTDENEALGVEASAGSVRGRTSRPVFAWRPGEHPRISDVNWEGDSLQVGEWWVPRDAPDGLTELVAGFPRLLDDGARVGDLEAGERPGFSAARHPRTAVGWDPDRGKLWIVVVDGRREGVSEGMTLDELATLFEALGVRDALNLDGGGSSTMVVGTRVVSRPADPSGPRPVVNALVIRHDPGLCAVRGGG
jgi:hypothetical protein